MRRLPSFASVQAACQQAARLYTLRQSPYRRCTPTVRNRWKPGLAGDGFRVTLWASVHSVENFDHAGPFAASTIRDHRALMARAHATEHASRLAGTVFIEANNSTRGKRGLPISNSIIPRATFVVETYL